MIDVASYRKGIDLFSALDLDRVPVSRADLRVLLDAYEAVFKARERRAKDKPRVRVKAITEAA